MSVRVNSSSAKLTDSIHSVEALEADTSVLSSRPLFVAVWTLVSAHSSTKNGTSLAFAFVGLSVILSINWTSDAVSSNNEKVLRASHAYSTRSTKSSSTFASTGAGIWDFVHSASDNALPANKHLTSSTLRASNTIPLSVAWQTIANTVSSRYTVRRAVISKHTSAAVHNKASFTNALSESVVVAVLIADDIAVWNAASVGHGESTVTNTLA